MNLASLLLNARSDRDAISYTVRKPNLRVRSIGKDLVTVSDKTSSKMHTAAVSTTRSSVLQAFANSPDQGLARSFLHNATGNERGLIIFH